MLDLWYQNALLFWCEGKKLTLTLTLTLYITVCQSVMAKSEGVRVEKEKLFFIKNEYPPSHTIYHQNFFS